ncbi:lasso peptide biosynthesis PqqD family chaperone [Streptomyces sp. NPDC055287]
MRSALLSLAVELGERLRTRQHAPKAVTMTMTFADRTQIHRSRQLPGGPSAHTDDLRDVAYEMYRALGLRRARMRAVALRCEQLVDAAEAAEQLSFDADREPRRGAPGLTLPTEPSYWVRAGARFADIRRVAARGSPLHLSGHGGDELFHTPPSHLHSLARSRPWTAARSVSERRALAHWPLGATWRALADSRDLPSWLARSAVQLNAAPPSQSHPQLGWTPALHMPPWTTQATAETVSDLLVQASKRRSEPLAPGRGPHTVINIREDTFDGLRHHRTTLLELFDGSELARLGLIDDETVRATLRTTHPTVLPSWHLSPPGLRSVVAQRVSDSLRAAAVPWNGRHRRQGRNPMTFALGTDVSRAETEHGTVLLDQRRGRYFQLNPSGSLILRTLLNGATPDHTAKSLTERYGTDPNRAHADVASLMNSLLTKGLART